MAARANSAMPPGCPTTAGLSFTISLVCGRAGLTARTSSRSSPGSPPNSVPPRTFGHETFSSTAGSAAIPSITAATCTKSSTLNPATEPMTVVGTPAIRGPTCSSNASIPMFARPMALSMPALVSRMRQVSLPSRASRVIDLVTIAPTFERSSTSASSSSVPAVPAARMTGVARRIPARSVARGSRSGIG